MKALFIAVVYRPLYNGLIFLLHVLPAADMGVAVILFTIIVRLILFPLSQKAVRAQLEMKELEGELNALKARYANDKEGQAKAIMAFYKEKNVNPFSSLLLVLIQIPIILALYFIFYRGGLPTVDTHLLYSFVQAPSVNMHFLGLIDVGKRNLLLALLAGITQYLQMRFAMPPLKKREEKGNFKDDLARSMNVQMRYLMPIFITFIAYSISGAVALYWTTNNLFAIGQELYVRSQKRRAAAVK